MSEVQRRRPLSSVAFLKTKLDRHSSPGLSAPEQDVPKEPVAECVDNLLNEVITDDQNEMSIQGAVFQTLHDLVETCESENKPDKPPPASPIATPVSDNQNTCSATDSPIYSIPKHNSVSADASVSEKIQV